MTNNIYTKKYAAPEINKKEILRYALVRSGTPELDELLQSCLLEVESKLTYNVCFREFPITAHDGYLDLGFAKTPSADLAKNLAGCGSIVLFACTVGIEIDRLIARYGSLSPSRSFMLQAIGAERIESLCDVFNRDLTSAKASDGLFTRPRFSPGYGDLPLEIQRDIFNVLDCPRKIGLTLNSSMLMSPTKSVTAIVGISDKGCKVNEKCDSCGKTDCIYRKSS